MTRSAIDPSGASEAGPATTGTGVVTTPRAVTYEIRVAGHLDDHWAAMLGDLALVRLDDGTTSLTGPVVDQAQLHGVLARIRDLGVSLLTLGALDCAGSSTPAQPETRPEAVRPALPKRVSTQRLTLRPAVPLDADATWAYRRLPSVGEWLTEVPTDLETYRAAFSDPHRLAATVIVERGGMLVGDFMLRIEDARARGRQAELGWVLDPAHTRQRYATEAVRGLLVHCFTDLDVRRVVASCFLADVASGRLMERVGMRREGHAVAASLHRSGQWLDTRTYALLAAEWTRPDLPARPASRAQATTTVPQDRGSLHARGPG